MSDDAIGYRAEIVEPCRALDAAASAVVVECTIRESDDFHAPGGVFYMKSETFTVDPQGRINLAEVSVLEFTGGGYFVYNQAFFDWLRDAHPDVHAEIRPALITHLPEDPDDMRRAMGYLDEFLTQSDVYPVEATP